MTSRPRPVTWITLIVLLALLRPAPLRVTAQQAELTTVAPKEAGFSSERLAALDSSLKKYIVFVGMIQRIIAPDMPNLQDLSRTLVQQALLAP